MMKNISRRLVAVVICVVLALVLAICFASCKNKPNKDEETSATTQVGGDIIPGEDDTTPGGDDTTPGGDDTTPGGDDTTPGGDDTTPGGDDTTPGGEDTTEETTSDHEHIYDEGTVTLEPTCANEGKKVYVCSVCQREKTEAIPRLEHDMGEWEQIIAPELNKEGLERRECKNCDHFEERAIEMLPAKWYITVNDGFGGTSTVRVGENGVYSLTTPVRVGYNFIGWKDSNGKDFAASGTISSDVTVTAIWELDATETIEELVERAAAGVDLIYIANDIVIDRPIYVPSTTKIYSDKPVKLIRDKEYLGDLFVIGQNAEGENSILMNLVPMLILGSEDYTGDTVMLTIDGNRDGMKDGTEVVGTALILLNGARVNMYNGVSISNHQKLGNERTLILNKYLVGSATYAGGSAVMISSGSSFYMYGGIMDNNSARIDSVVLEDGTSSNLSGYGGAVYNNGTFRMYGGAITNCSANRGGAIYSDAILEITGGVLEGNYAKNKGGAICSSGSDASDMFIGVKGAEIGTVVIKNNSAGTQGGAILSYADSPLILFGGVLFESNSALGNNGGAISTSGPITSYGNSFVGNKAKYSGGAIYQSYSSSELIVRIVELHDTVFEGNSANKGGAITLTSSSGTDVGAYGKLVNCKFINNSALHYLSTKTDSETGEVKTSVNGGNGGAVYSSQHSNFDIEGCEFVGNKSENLGGGAIGATVSSTINIKDCLFENNASVDADGDENGKSGVGGAIYAYNGTALTVSNTKFIGNSANKNGGALYLSDNKVQLTDIELVKNSAGLNGGAIAHYSNNVLDIKGVYAVGNTANGSGGVVYNSRATLNLISDENTENVFGALGADDAESTELANTAANGGALCGGNNSIFSINGAVFENNAAVATEIQVNNEETGEPYIDYEDGSGGAVYASYNTVLDFQNVRFSSNSAKNGGAIFANKDASMLFDTLTFEDNTANAKEFDKDARGGAIYMIDVTLTANNIEFKGNHADYYGGAIDAHTGSKATINNVSFVGNSALNNGGALWLYTNTEFDITGIYASGNQSNSSGGFVYTRGTLNIRDGGDISNVFEGVAADADSINNAKGGGAIYCGASSSVSVEKAEFKNLSASNGGAIYVTGELTATDCNFSNNDAANGGAVYIERTAYLANCTFTNNTANAKGGAVYVAYDADYKNELKATVENSKFVSNNATEGGTNEERRGGAIYIGEYCIVNVSGSEFEDNHATQYGGAISAARGAELNISSSKIKGSSAKNGGAIWLYAGTTLNISDSELSNNAAQKEGGALYSYNTINASGTMFTENTANVGGAITVASGTTTTVGCAFDSNKATSGGAVYVSNGVYFDGTEGVSESGSAFTANSASYRGGAVYIVNADEQTGENKAVFNYSVFKSNTATEGGEDAKRRGGAISIAEYVTVTVNNSLFHENAATQYGGAVNVARGSVLYVNDSEFYKNTANYNGGAIWLYSGTTLELSGGEFNENAVNTNGGALYSYSTVTVSNAKFNKNAAENGGAICVAGGETAISECAFDSNTATLGGAVYVGEGASFLDGIDTSDIVKTGSVYNGNTAEYGGAIYLAAVEDPEKTPDREAAKATLEESEFTGNTGTKYGGAIYASAGVALNTDSVSFNDNSASNGGAISVASSSCVYVDNGSQFVGNVATDGEGGAIHSKGSLELTSSKFIGNKTEAESKRGGAIYLTSGYINAEGVIFENNYAANNGGAIVMTSAQSASFDNCTFENNVSGYRGGAIYITGTTDVKTTACKFEGNEAVNRGGAVYLTTSGGFVDGEISVADSNSTFIGNKSLVGGAIFVDKTATLNGTVFENNTAASAESGTSANGGAIAGEYGTVTLNGVSINRNTADNGGAIFDGKRLALVINGANITENSSGIVISGGSVSVSGNVIIKDNTSYDVSLSEGKLITVADVLDQTSRIGFSAVGNIGEFVTADGSNVTDVTQYADIFFNNDGYPVFVNSEGKLVYGFVIFEQPVRMNGYTVITSGQPTSYTWYTWVDGAKGEIVEGQTTATLTGGMAGQSYVCVIALGDKTVETLPVTVKAEIPSQNHSICGSICDCTDTTHEELVWNAVSDLGELIYAAAKGGNYYLTEDIIVDATVKITANVNLCLNGKKISRAGDEAFRMLEVAAGVTLTLTDCTSEERVGYIDSTTGLWTEGVYSGEETVTEYKLYGGLITNGTGAGGAAIYLDGGTLNAYGINFAGNTTANSGSAVCGSGTYNDVGSVFVGNAASGQAGAVQIDGDITLKYTQFISNKSTGNRAGALLITVGRANAYGVVFKNNIASTNGGAVVVTGAEICIFDNCTFEGNVSGGRAGAIYAHKTELITTLSCTFTDNEGVDGGAIYNTSTAAYVDGSVDDKTKGSTFTANSATNGGAVYTAGSVILYGTKFEGNSSTSGGAIYVNGKLETNDCLFNGNEAYYRGGAVYIVADDAQTGENKAVFNNSTFTSNRATAGGTDEKRRGGAIYVAEKVTVAVNGCTFTDNAATQYGGAIDVANTSILNVTESDFIGNSAQNGGAIWLYSNTVLSVSGGEFKDNVASSYGGAIYSYNTVTVTDVTFTGNVAAAGGALYVAGGATSTKNCTFSGNTATTGGAVCVAKGSYTDGELVLDGETVIDTANGSEFIGNIAENGGAIYVSGGTANAYGSTFTENSAKVDVAETTDSESGAATSVKTYLGNGGAIYVASGAAYNDRTASYNGNIAALGGAIYTVGGTVNSTDSTFTENAAITSETTVTANETTETTVVYGKGGAVYVAENGVFNYTATEKLTFTNGVANDYTGPKFDGNLAANGAAIYIASAETEGASAGTATAIGATIMNHNATGNGGAIYANGVLNTEGSVIYKNSTQGNGGAIYANKPYTDNGSLFVENTASGEGGAIRAGTNVTIENTKFIRNKSTGNRAGALLVTSGSLNAKKVTFEYNDAYKAGGAVVLTAAKASVFEECIFNNNIDQTYRGGAIYMHNSELVTTLSCTFTGNSGKYGGAIYGTNSATYTDGSADGNYGSAFTGNTSQTAGGAIYILGECHLYGTTFNNNTATTNGGAIYTSTTNTISNATFNQNGAVLGGAIYVAGGATSTKDCSFSGNTATNGGAVYVAKGTYTDGEAILTGESVTGAENGSTFSNNSSTGTELGGGAIYTATGAVLQGSKFENNISALNGGAVYSTGDLTTYYANFTKNETVGSGGAIYIIGDAELVVVGGTMKENKTGSSKSGGAIAAFENESKASPTCYISGTTFNGNSSYSGGAICLRNTGTTKTEHVLENITLTNNNGGNGTVYIYNNTKVTVSGLVATNNTASQRGSVFYVTSSNAPSLILKDAQVSGNVVKSAIDIIHIANKSAVVDVYMDKISGDDFIAAGITDTTNIAAAGWDKLINNASNGTVTGYTTPVDYGSGVSAE